MAASELLFIIYTAVGYIADIIMNFLVIKYLLKSEASLSSVGLYGVIQNTVSYVLGFLFGFSLIAFNLANFTETVIVVIGWFIITFLMGYKMLGIESVRKLLAFILMDTGLDYLVGGVVSVPTANNLLTIIPSQTVSPISPALANIAPLSLRLITIPIAIAVFLAFYVVQTHVDGDKPPELITEPSN